MEYLELLDKTKECIAFAPPPCVSECPLRLDVRGFITKIRTGLYSAAYKLMKRSFVLPGVVCHICKEPCKNICPRDGYDEAVSLRELELFCWHECHEKPDVSYYSPPKNEMILVIGGGPVGIACAVKMTDKRYPVDLYVPSDRLGGILNIIDESILPRSVLTWELEALKKIKHLTIHTNQSIKAENIPPKGYKAVIDTTGYSDGQGIYRGNGVFKLPESDYTQNPMEAIYAGCAVAYMLEEYIKIDTVRSTLDKKDLPKFKPSISGVPHKYKPVLENGARIMTAEQANEEAERCLLCACNRCVDNCIMMRHYNFNFVQFAKNVYDTVLSVRTNEKRTALYPLMSCTHCGACKHSCPIGIDGKKMCIDSRKALRDISALPIAHYDYWYNDLIHARSDEAKVFIASSPCKFIYFPGCQLSASKPDAISNSYRWLRDHFDESVSLYVDCCGAPAAWMGDTQERQRIADDINKVWVESGKPNFILCCTSCAEMFAEYLPEIEFCFLWEIMAAEYCINCNGESKGPVAVFDPCSSADFPKARESIRRLLNNIGYKTVDLDIYKDEAPCCGFGGLIYTSNPTLHKKINDYNTSFSSLPYVTYCSNCNDNLQLHHKDATHILDLAFNITRRNTVPDLDVRRSNRSKLKIEVLKEYLNIEFAIAKSPYDHIELIISAEMRQKLNNQLILDDCIRQVLAYSESTGYMSCSASDDLYTAYKQIGQITYWVQFRKQGKAYEISNAYYHRMTIVER